MTKPRLAAAPFLCLLVSLLLLPVVSASPADDEIADSDIAFLQFRTDGEKISLVDSRVVPGSLKRARLPELNREITYEVGAKTSGIVFEGSLANPLVKRLEYEDPDNPGQLKSKTIELTEAEFTLRIPYREEIDHITFYRTEPSDQAEGKSTVRTIISTVPLDFNKEVK